MTQGLNSWPEVIRHYIDELGEHDKQQQYLDELIAAFLSSHLSQIKTDSASEKALKAITKKIHNKPATSRNRQIFEDCYQELLTRGWVSDISAELQSLRNKSDFYNIWICRTVLLSEGIRPATHAAKLAHSSTSGSSLLDRTGTQREGMLTTSSLKTEILDGTYPNAVVSRQTNFLLLKYNGQYFFDAINDVSKAGLDAFADDETELQRWLDRYHQILNAPPKSDALVKQIYFPVSPQGYHLLTVLKSSSLAQYIHNAHFSKEARDEKKPFASAKKKKQYIKGSYTQLLNVNKLQVTQSQHQNATILNGKRGGALRLLSCQPPVWKSQLKPPVHQNSWFYRGIPYNVIKDDIHYLREFLLRNERLGLSMRSPEKRAWLIKWGQRIINHVMFYAQAIQSLPSGWSNTPDIKLKPEQQYFLDPFRDDDAFQEARKSGDWQKVVSQDFAFWFNQKLIGQKKQFTPQPEHRKLWALLMADELRYDNPLPQVSLQNPQRSDP